MRDADRKSLEDFVWKARAAVEAVERFLGRGTMARQSPTFSDFNPTKDKRVDLIKHGTDTLIGIVREKTEGGGPETKRRASLAITAYEQASMWAVKALFSEDAVEGDDGGAQGPDPHAPKDGGVGKRPLDARVSPNDEGLDGIDRRGP